MGGMQATRDRLAELEALIPRLKEERNDLRAKLRALRFPVLTLPVEVTSEIFLHCLPRLSDSDLDFKYGGMRPRSRDAPLLLLRICRTWRDIALGITRLWSTISLVDTPKLLDKKDLEYAMFTKWMERTGTRPLTLLLRCKGEVSLNTDRGAFTPLLQRTHQWQDATIYFEQEGLAYKSFRGSSFPILRRLRIRGQIFPRDSWFTSNPITAFEVAPNLTMVQLTRLAPSLIRLPWEQLTSFSGRSIAPDGCLHVLRMASSLVHCAFQSISESDETDHADDTPPPDRPIVHPHLQSLDLGYANDHHFLIHLTLPALTALKVYIPAGANQVEQLLSRGGMVLQRLAVTCEGDSLLGLLPFLGGLTDLTISCLIDRGRFMTILRSLHVYESGSFLPHLRSFSVELPARRTYNWVDGTRVALEPTVEEDMNYEELADALWTRWTGTESQSGVARLESFSIVWVDPADYDGEEDMWTLGFDETQLCRQLEAEGISDRLLDLVEKGMHINLGTQIRQWVA
ncbi:hypothetical protein C8R47DRAFT_1201467 [Mycena vitilis]|nr:hypothetical protein C8R47DRAFT_1201467 [Mycena vitilis]